MIRWNCRQCGEGLEAPQSMAGQMLACAACKATVRIPAATVERPAPTSSTRRTAVLIAAPVVALVLGYFAGREHLKYELRSALEGVGRALSDGPGASESTVEQTGGWQRR